MVVKQGGIDTGEVAEHLNRLVKSDLLRRSGTLSHLLEYLVDRALHGDADHLKESTIAIELFHRGNDFDSKVDNIVRVHAHRLRRVLDTWYLGEGANDKLLFSIPKGSYTLHIEQKDADFRQDSTDLAVHAAPLPATREPLPLRPRSFNWRGITRAIGFAFLGALAMYIGLDLTGRIRGLHNIPGDLSTQPLRALWGGIFRPGSSTVVSFTNPAFLRTNSATSRAYLTYKGPLNAAVGAEFKVHPDDPFVDKRVTSLGPFYFNESWTGIGEIMAVHKLTEMTERSGFHFRLVRGRALTYNDMQGSNVIFLGSPWANDMQAKFNIGITPFQCFGTENIVNNTPKSGEPAAWYPELNSTTKELNATYGLFSVLPGLTSGTKIVSSSGIDNYATLAALDMMTSPDGVRALMRRFGTERSQTLPEYFQAVIRTELIRGDPANASIMAVRPLNPK